MKIAIIGYSGCGKSTLARYLGKKYKAEVLYLDKVHWLPGWREQERDREKAAVRRFLDTHSSWVIDGNYGDLLYGRRLREADQILFLNFNRVACLCQALKRYLRFRGQSRDSMTPGCPEKLDAEFVRWILWDGRRKKYRDRYRAVMRKYPEKVVVIRGQRELERYKKSLPLSPASFTYAANSRCLH